MATESKLILTAEDRTAAAWASLKAKGSAAFGAVEAAGADTARTLAGTFAGVFGGLAVAGIYEAFITQTLEANGTVLDLQESFGATLEGLSQIGAGAALSGQSLADMEGPLNKITKSLGEASDESSDSARAFKALGLNLGDIRKMSPDQVMIAVAKASQDFANGAGKAAVMTALFGKEGAKLIPVLNDIAEAEGKYLKLTQEQIDASDAFDKNIKRLKASFADFKLGIGNDVIPALNELIEFTRRAQKEYGSFLGLLVGGLGGGTLKLLGVDLDEMKRAETEVSDTFKRLAKARQELTDQRELKQKGLGIGFVVDNNIKNAEEAIAKETALLKQAIKNRDALAAARANGGAPKLAAPDFTPKAPAAEKTKEEKPKKEVVSFEISAALSGLSSIVKAQNAADNAGRTLTASQQILLDLMRSPEWDLMPEPWREVIVAQTAAAVEAETAAQRLKRLNELLAATDTSKLETARADMQLLADAFERGEISADQFQEAATAALGLVGEKGKDEFQQLLDAINGWSREASDAIAQVVMSGSLSLKSLGSIMDTIVQKMLAMAIQKQLMDPLFKMGSDVLASSASKPPAGAGQGAGMLEGLLAMGKSFVGSFDVGTDYVPRTGLALIHQGERIIPAADNAAGRFGGGTTVTNNFHLSGPVDARTQAQIAAQAAAAISRAQRRNG